MRRTAIVIVLLIASFAGASAEPVRPSWFQFKMTDDDFPYRDVYRYTCRDFANAIIAARVRIASLKDLRFQSQFDPVGPLVFAIDSSPQLAEAHREKDRLIAAARLNRCRIPPPTVRTWKGQRWRTP